MTDRTLTVSSLYPSLPSPSKRRSFRQTRRQKAVPFLRLSGRWLEAAGFEIGSKVRVVVEAERLVGRCVRRSFGCRDSIVRVGQQLLLWSGRRRSCCWWDHGWRRRGLLQGIRCG